MLVDYVITMGSYADLKIGDVAADAKRSWLRLPLNLASPFVYNPRASFNLYGEFITDQAELLARREMAKLTPRADRFHREEARPRFKNFTGALFMQAAVPAYQKISETYWDTQDKRAALLARLVGT